MPPARAGVRVKVVVVGSGVLGISAAWALQEAGAEVTVVEADAPGAGTSSRGAGLVCEGMWHPTSLRLVVRSRERLEALSEEDMGPFKLHRIGSTTLVPERLAEAARTLARHQAEAGAEVRVLDPSELRGLPRHESMRLDDVALAVHYPRDGWALPRLYCEVGSFVLEEMGARFVRARARLERGEGGWRVRAGDATLGADAVILAVGIHTRGLLREAGLDAPILPYRTQAMRFHHADAASVPMVHDVVQGFYLRPHWTGQLVAGNGTTTTPEDPDLWKREADEAFLDLTRRRIAHRFPRLASGKVMEGWAGLDAATPDRLLLAGRYPGEEGLWLLAGGNGHGFMRAPAAGESLAALVMGRKPPVDLGAYDPARFAGAPTTFEIREGYSLESPSFM